MRLLSSLAVAALLAGTAAQAASITDSAASIALWSGDIIADAAAPVSADVAVDYAFLSGGPGLSYALSLENLGAQILFAETDTYTYDGAHVLSFLFDLADDATFGDWLTVTYTFDETITDPFAASIDGTYTANMAITWGTDIPAVPAPATLPLLLGALAAGSALLRRKA